MLGERRETSKGTEEVAKPALLPTLLAPGLPSVPAQAWVINLLPPGELP